MDSAAPEVFADTHPDVKRGIAKQFEILRRWIPDPTQPLAQ